MALETATHSELDEIVNRLVDALSPEAIYLFGSYAKGEASDESDIDLLVIVSDDAGNQQDVYARGSDALWGIGRPVDLIVFHRSFMDQWANVPTFLPNEVAKTGKLLYAA